MTSPRSDETAEHAVLGACLLDSGAIPLVRRYVSPEAFFWGSHKVIWAAMLSLYDAGDKLDFVTLRQEVWEQDKTIPENELYALGEGVPDLAHAAEYAEIVHDLAWQREALRFACELEVTAGEGSPAATELVLRTGYDQLLRVKSPTGYAGSDLVRVVKEEFAAGKDAIVNGAAFGIEQLDEAVGGFVPGRYYVLGARPGMGKTSLALHAFWTCVRRGLRALFISLEMSASDLIARLASQLSGKSLSALRHVARRREDYQAFMDALDRIEEAGERIAVGNPKDTSIGAIIGDIRGQLEAGPLGLVVVDYLQRVDDPKERNDTARVSNVSRRLADFARQANVPVLAIAQLRRFGEGRDESSEPQLADLRQSGQIENDADVVLMLWGKVAEELRRWRLAKGRFGPPAQGSLRFDGRCTRFNGYWGGAVSAPNPKIEDVPFNRKERQWRLMQP